jgi:hypothetical protein
MANHSTRQADATKILTKREMAMEDLAQAIDGSNPGRYSLRLYSK